MDASSILESEWKPSDEEKQVLPRDPMLQTLSTNVAQAHPDRNSDKYTDYLNNEKESIGTNASVDRLNRRNTYASLELPFSWDGDNLVMERNVRTTVMCVIPQNSNHGRWSGTIGGSSVVRGSIGCATGSMTVAYHPESRRNIPATTLHGGMQVGDQANIHVGGTIRTTDQKSCLGVTVTSIPPTLTSPWGKTSTRLTAKHAFSTRHPMVATAHAQVLASSFSSLSPSLLLPASASISLTSMTKHKLQLALGWHHNRANVQLRLHPKLSKHRHADLTCQYKGGGWHLGFVLKQFLAPSKVASFGVGVWHAHKDRLSWILSWNRGDTTIRIPIFISKMTATTATGSLLLYYTQLLYLSMLSCLIQEAVADLWNVKGEKGDDSPEQQQQQETLQREQALMQREKARADAEQQKQLMTRQAESRRKVEEETGGLVIRSAVYYAQQECSGGSGGRDTWDVTTQLQFWTQNSTLELPAVSKRNLLGFYDVSTLASLSPLSSGSRSSWWTDLWRTPEVPPKIVPKLRVQYEFSGRSYVITILDDEPLVLPSNKAVLLNT